MSAREHMQQEMVKCQRAARRITLAERGKCMLLTDAMLSDHRNALRDTPDQPESFCAKGRCSERQVVSRLNWEQLSATWS